MIPGDCNRYFRNILPRVQLCEHRLESAQNFCTNRGNDEFLPSFAPRPCVRSYNISSATSFFPLLSWKPKCHSAIVVHGFATQWHSTHHDNPPQELLCNTHRHHIDDREQCTPEHRRSTNKKFVSIHGSRGDNNAHVISAVPSDILDKALGGVSAQWTFMDYVNHYDIIRIQVWFRQKSPQWRTIPVGLLRSCQSTIPSVTNLMTGSSFL